MVSERISKSTKERKTVPTYVVEENSPLLNGANDTQIRSGLKDGSVTLQPELPNTSDQVFVDHVKVPDAPLPTLHKKRLEKGENDKKVQELLDQHKKEVEALVRKLNNSDTINSLSNEFEDFLADLETNGLKLTVGTTVASNAFTITDIEP